MENKIDFICQHKMDGDTIPLRIRLRDEDGELQEYTVKGYRDTSQFGITSFECQILVRNELKVVSVRSSDMKVWNLSYER